MNLWIQDAIDLIARYNWDSPLSFALIIVAILILFGKWRYVGIIFLSAFLAVVARDLIVMNISTMREVISVPEFILCGGGVVIMIMFGVAFLKYMIS